MMKTFLGANWHSFPSTLIKSKQSCCLADRFCGFCCSCSLLSSHCIAAGNLRSSLMIGQIFGGTWCFFSCWEKWNGLLQCFFTDGWAHHFLSLCWKYYVISECVRTGFSGDGEALFLSQLLALCLKQKMEQSFNFNQWKSTKLFIQLFLNVSGCISIFKAIIVWLQSTGRWHLLEVFLSAGLGFFCCFFALHLNFFLVLLWERRLVKFEVLMLDWTFLTSGLNGLNKSNYGKAFVFYVTNQHF